MPLVTLEDKGDSMNERKRQVLLIAQRLFAEKGFTATSVQDILDESQISKGTFYNYFTSKNECLLVMLEYAYDEAIIKRRELLIGQDIQDKNILSQQIVVRMQINREHNLLPIYESIFHSGDVDLRSFIIKQHFLEISWLAGRLVDVYGKEATPYAPDCAVILMGMIQHLMHFGSASPTGKVDLNRLVHFTTRRIDAIIRDTIKSNDILIGTDLFLDLPPKAEPPADAKNVLHVQLGKFLANLTDDANANGVQYAEFLLDEISADQPRVFLLEIIARSFHESFTNTRYEPEVREIIAVLWSYVDTLKKKDFH